jgi:chemotaxis protein histidine kinase CheA
LNQLRGTCELHSAAGKGTEVVLRIPIAQRAPAHSGDGRSVT